jgi:hypothetical protein
MNGNENAVRVGFLTPEYDAMFGRQWAPWVAGILIGVLNVMMFAYAKPWAVAEGVRNWGYWVLNGVGIEAGAQISPLVFTTSVTNLSVAFGALIAALLSRQFGLRLPYGRDLVRALLGGILLGIGSVLGMGCTIGGFLSAYSALSLAGPLFMLGLAGGAYLGLRLLLWDLAREKPRPQAAPAAAAGRGDWRAYQPLLGLLLLAAVVGVLLWDRRTFTYAGIEGLRSVLIAFGVLLGIVSQRSRFCFVRAFREPYMTGDGAMAKGVALALLVGVVGFAIVKGTDLSDYRPIDAFVNPSVWVGSLVGGLIFGVGMVLTGGCASGSLWRVGEGQLKFVVVLLAFAVTNAALTLYLQTTGLRNAWGEQAVFLPNRLGWAGALAFLLILPLVWIALAAWNEKSEKLVVT